MKKGLLRVPRIVSDRVFQGVKAMQQSTTYQGILEDGRIDEARRIILRQGRKRFGKPSAAVQAKIEGRANLDQLERLTDRILAASNWQELLESV
jgi:hypothetical protein